MPPFEPFCVPELRESVAAAELMHAAAVRIIVMAVAFRFMTVVFDESVCVSFIAGGKNKQKSWKNKLICSSGTIS